MIFRSPYPDVRVPDVALHRFVLAGAVERADQPALIDRPSGRALTHGQLAAGGGGPPGGLPPAGVPPGGVVPPFLPKPPPVPPPLYRPPPARRARAPGEPL